MIISDFFPLLYKNLTCPIAQSEENWSAPFHVSNWFLAHFTKWKKVCQKTDIQSNSQPTYSSSSNLQSVYRKNFKQAFSPVQPKNYKGKGKVYPKVITESNTKYTVQHYNKDFKIINKNNNYLPNSHYQKNLIDLDMDIVEIPVLQKEVKS